MSDTTFPVPTMVVVLLPVILLSSLSQLVTKSNITRIMSIDDRKVFMMNSPFYEELIQYKFTEADNLKL